MTPTEMTVNYEKKQIKLTFRTSHEALGWQIRTRESGMASNLERCRVRGPNGEGQPVTLTYDVTGNMTRVVSHLL